jgi:hypothetical protein
VAERSKARAADRQKRMDRRENGPPVFEQLMAAATNGNQAAGSILTSMLRNQAMQGQYAGLAEQRQAEAGLANAQAQEIGDNRQLQNDPAFRREAQVQNMIAAGYTPDQVDQMLGMSGGGGDSTTVPSASTITSGIDRIMGEGFAQRLTDAADTSTPSGLGQFMPGGYAVPNSPINKIAPMLEQLDQAGALSDPSIRSSVSGLLKRNIAPEYMSVLQKMKNVPDNASWESGYTSLLDNLSGRGKKLGKRAQFMLDLIGGSDAAR